MEQAPRIGPVPDAELSPEQRKLLDEVGGPAGDAGTLNIFLTLIRHPSLFRRWLPFGGKLLSGKLPARDREVLILRTAVNCGAPYEWAQHVRIGRAAGLSRGEIDAIGDRSTRWEGPDAILIRAADELHETSKIGDDTWAALEAVYDERQLIEVPFVVGHYHLVAYALNSLGVQLEEGFDADGAELSGPRAD